MSKNRNRQNRAVSNRLHPRVYTVMVALALWLAAAVWAFDSDNYAGYLLAIVSGFICIAVTLPLVLSRVGTRDPGARGSRSQADEQQGTFRDWTQGEFDTWQDRVKGSDAAVEVLLPIAALAFGMTAIGIVYLVVHSVS